MAAADSSPPSDLESHIAHSFHPFSIVRAVRERLAWLSERERLAWLGEREKLAWRGERERLAWLRES